MQSPPGGHSDVDLLMDRLHDPAVLALPHPVRVDAAVGVPIEASMLGGVKTKPYGVR